ncbi:MAG: ATP-dependent dethiobiotin synthetase BioD, partial [Verrucomicrobiales bacterium]
LDDALQEIKHAATQCSTLLIEGAGGLMAPLGEGFNALDLITAIRAETIVVAPNKLGVLNHCMLTIRELRRSKVEKVQLALVNQPAPDPSASSNAQLLIELLQPIVPLQVPWFPPDRLKQLRENFLSSSDRGLRETFSVIMNS